MSVDRLKVAFIGARGVGSTYSGIESYYEEVGSRLAARGHEVTAYCRTHFTPDVSEFRGIRVKRLPSLRTKHLETLSHSVLSTLHALPRDYDVIQYHAIGSSPLAVLPRLLGRRTVVSVRGLDHQRGKWGTVARTDLRFGEWASVRRPSATIVVSETLGRHYQERHGREAAVIPNAIVKATHEPADRIRKLGLSGDDFVLFAGRVSPEKGVHTLLEAMRPLPRDKKLVIAGGTSYSDDYIERVKRLAWDEVMFLGQVDRATMSELYSNCYAFVLPSVMEGLSIALLEALSYGTCIITTDIPENVEVVGSAGLCFPPSDVEALRNILARVLADPGLVRQYRKRAAERAASLPDWDEVARRTEAFYLELLKGPRPAPA
jgi:glycosyltransferase involved in cell wall biosynthesis